MCNLLIAHKKNGTKDEAIRSAIDFQRKDLKSMEDGIALFTVSENGECFREFSTNKADYDGIIDLAMEAVSESKLVCLHTRKATIGRISGANCHYYESKGTYTAQNGGFYKLGNRTMGKEEKEWFGEKEVWQTAYGVAAEKSDTREFSELLSSGMKIETIVELASTCGMWGVIHVYDSKKKINHIITDQNKKTYLISDGKNYGVITSWIPDMERKTDSIIRVYGIPTTTGKKIEKLDGVRFDILPCYYSFKL